jgi:hypothetical protein
MHILSIFHNHYLSICTADAARIILVFGLINLMIKTTWLAMRLFGLHLILHGKMTLIPRVVEVTL